ncbi:MAG TPA: R3H domain-containing nucleic acid-binding protein [Luteolibacter sp.]|nr:R3H domain-containing nucleic acid-binding protein [Luteolibacter sp.]
MSHVEAATKILDTMLGHLGIPAEIEPQECEEGPCLQIRSSQSELIIGKHGERLDDFQYLVNRILRRQHADAPRIRIDCEHYRSMREDEMTKEVLEIAQRVKETGKPHQLRPLNAYYRRIVHNALIGDSEIQTHSPKGEQRLKRITIARKDSPAEGQ